MKIVSRSVLAVLCSMSLVFTLSCAGGASSSAPSSTSGPFNGTWSGTMDVIGFPVTMTLAQSGSAVTGTFTMTLTTCSVCYSGPQTVRGTASGNTLTATITYPDGVIDYSNATFTANGSTMAVQLPDPPRSTLTSTMVAGGVPPPAAPPTASTPSITSTPGAVTLSTSSAFCPAFCTVFQNITINSSTAWTSTVPGFGNLGEGFSVSPASGPVGSTIVAITYRYLVPQPSNGFIRFRTTVSGLYVEVPVVLNVK